MIAERVAVLSVALALVLPACATPRIVLTPGFANGEVRYYRLTADVRTVTDVPGAASDDRTVLRADVRVEIGRDGEAATATVTVTPTTFRRDDADAEPPPEQQARIVFDDAGRVESVSSPSGGAIPLGGSAEDVGTIFGSTIARGPVKIADRWREPIAGPDGGVEEDGATDGAPGGLRRSRVAALRWVSGYRCVVVESATSRPVQRSRQAGGATLSLAGTEVANVTTAFAFDRGFPVSIESAATGTFDVAGLPQRGTVTISSTTTIVLQRVESGERRAVPGEEPSPGTSPTTSATATAQARGSRSPARR